MGTTLGARIMDIEYPAAVFTLSANTACCWNWLDSANGHWVIFDTISVNKSVPLSSGQIFRSVTEHHLSYHRDGRRQRTLQVSGRPKPARVSRENDAAFGGIRTWKSLRSIAVPLVGPFGSAMDAAVWRDVQRPQILCSEDFDGAEGINLHGYICKQRSVTDLISFWRCVQRHWVAGTGDLRVVILAEPIFISGKRDAS